ncbi:hypothetical protein FUT87_27495 [Mitsuaria sp. TWR114]|nr:hypothetical protein FUT87_27495 [Mitsuaria sp. TWR114]
MPLLICLRSISQRNRHMRPVAVYLRGSDRALPAAEQPAAPAALVAAVSIADALVAGRRLGVPPSSTSPVTSLDGAAPAARPDALEQHRP